MGQKGRVRAMRLYDERDLRLDLPIDVEAGIADILKSES